MAVPSDTSDTTETDSAVLRLPSTLCVDSAQELLIALAADAERQSAAKVDAGEVSRIDTAGLQLLTAAVLQAQKRGRGWHWLRVSTALRDAARAAGLDAALSIGTAD